MSLSACATWSEQKKMSAKHDLVFNPDQYQMQEITVDGKSFKIRAYENIVYVQYPVDKDYQYMNIYIPDAYYQGKSIDGFTAQTAPIFFPNQIGGYMPAKAGTAQPPTQGRGAGKQTTIAVALSKGYIVATPAARGRTATTGKAPAAIMDLKAAVRYLHFNDRVMLGTAEKIISNGTSAGGALSALLGATGNHHDYTTELKAMGAANARDDIFAVSAYCPITNLEHADMAYEWLFNGYNEYKKINISMLDYHVQRQEVAGTLSSTEIEYSHQLKQLFIPYLNQLQLKDLQGHVLSLNDQGNGSFKEYVKQYVIQSAQWALDQGTDLSHLTWIEIKNNKVMDLNFDQYIAYIGRMKSPPAFDAVDLSSGENQLFGSATVDKRHFTSYSMQHHQGNEAAQKAEDQLVKMMNPMYYIEPAQSKKQQTSPYWRIRHGSKDRDTSLAIPIILATTLNNKGYSVDFAVPWDQGHGGDYDLDELFTWTKHIAQQKE